VNPGDLHLRFVLATDVLSDSPETMALGVERCRADFGFEQDRVKRFTWWGLPHRLGSAPDLEPCSRILMIAALPAISWTFLLQAEAPQPAMKRWTITLPSCPHRIQSGFSCEPV